MFRSSRLLLSSWRRLGERLQLEVLLEPGDAHLPADAGLLVPAERNVGAVVQAAVDRHRARPDAPSNGVYSVTIAPAHRARQPIDRVVGDAHGIIIVSVRNGDKY